MSAESTREVVMRYLSSDHTAAEVLANDVVFTIMSTGEQYVGPEVVEDMLHYFYQVAFDAAAETRNFIVGDSQAVLEADFVGKHISEFAGIPPTHKDVRVPLCVVYDVEGGQIKRGRIYMEMPVMMQQLGVQPS